MTDKLARTNITSEDCVLPEMTGKYDLVFYTSQRARAIINGSEPLVEGFDKPKDHSILVAMEELRQGKLTFADLMASLATPFAEPVREPSEKFFKVEDFDEDFDEELDEEEVKKLNYKTEEEYED